MADLTTYKTADVLVPQKEDAGSYHICKKINIANAAAANGDRIQLLVVGRAGRLQSAIVNALATLGAACTIKLQRDRAGVYTDLTIATTAGGASLVNSSTIGPKDLAVGDVLSLLVGGANVGAAAAVEIDLTLNHAPSI